MYMHMAFSFAKPGSLRLAAIASSQPERVETLGRNGYGFRRWTLCDIPDLNMLLFHMSKTRFSFDEKPHNRYNALRRTSDDLAVSKV